MSNGPVKPSGVLRVDGEATSLGTYQLSASVNSLPTVRGVFDFQAGGGILRKVTDQSFFNTVVRAQSSIYGERESPDVVLNLQDGLGGDLSFSGYLNAVDNPLGINTQVTLTALEKDAVIGSIDFSKYQWPRLYQQVAQEGDSPPTASGLAQTLLVQYLDVLGSAGSPLASRIQRIMQYLRDGLTGGLDQLSGKQSTRVRALALELESQVNNQFMDTFIGLLARSVPESEIQGYAAALGVNPTARNQSGLLIIDFLLQNLFWTPGGMFRNLVTQVLPRFSQQYVGDFNGESYFGQYTPTATPDDELVIPVNIGSSVSLGSTRMVPIKAVMVTANNSGQSVYGEVARGENAQAGNPVLSFFPADFSESANGKLVEIKAPFWMPRINYYNLLTREQREAGVSLANVQQFMNEFIKPRLPKTQKALADYFEEYARMNYSIFRLEASRAQVKTNLNFQPRIGRVYSVVAEGGGGRTLFTGFLESVGHSVSLDQGAGNSGTTLGFSHVRMTGADNL